MNAGQSSKGIIDKDKEGKIKNFKELLPLSSQKEWNNTSKCKCHSDKEATKICLHASCSLTRKICNECELLPPHSTHSQMVFDQRKFLVETELGLKGIQMNSPLSGATEMLERGRLFFQRHFQSMVNMLVEKSPTYFKVLALIEQTEGVKKQSMGTFELERYVREVMSLFIVDNSGNLTPTQPNSCLSEDTALKEDINDIFFMLRELENGVRLIHDEFALALKFTQNGVTQRQENNTMRSQSNSQIDSMNNKTSDCNKKRMNSLKDQNENPNLLPIPPKPNKNDFKEDESKNSNFSSFQNGSNLDKFSQSLNYQALNNQEVLVDPSFFQKRKKGRPPGSKCKLQGKMKRKYTDEEKIAILREVEDIKSVQEVADRYFIQNSFIKKWARQLKFELDPQTIASRRPYRTFSREQKKIIIAEAIMKRDIVIVAQKYDVNAQVVKRWILKSAQGGLLPQQEMRQLINAVSNEEGQEDDYEEDEYEEEEGEEEEENDDGYEEENNDQGEDIKLKTRTGDMSEEDNSKIVEDEEDDEDDEEEEEGNDSESNKQKKSEKFKDEQIDKDQFMQEKNEENNESNLRENKKISNEIKQFPRKKLKREEGVAHQTNQYQTNQKSESSLQQGLLSLGLDLKNLDLLSDTKQQSQQLELFQKQLQEQILALKQRQLENQLTKQASQYPSLIMEEQKL